MSGKWTIKIEAYSSSFEGVRGVVMSAAQEIGAAKNYREIPHGWGGVGGGDPIGMGVSITCQGPVADRVRALREEADRLEREGQ